MFQFGGGDNESSEHSFSPEGTVRLVTVQPNSVTSTASAAQHSSRVTSSAAAGRGQIRRSQTFTPPAFKHPDDSLRNTVRVHTDLVRVYMFWQFSNDIVVSSYVYMYMGVIALRCKVFMIHSGLSAFRTSVIDRCCNAHAGLLCLLIMSTASISFS